MTFEQRIDAVRDFLFDMVCSYMRLKRPFDDDPDKVEWVQPAAYSTYLPTRDKMPDNLELPVPSLIVIPLSDARYLDHNLMRVRVIFQTWDIGTREETEEGEIDVDLSYDGWRPLVTFMQRAEDELAMRGVVGNMEVEYPITKGLFNEAEATPDMRPYYLGWLEVSFKSVLASRYRRDVQQLLD